MSFWENVERELKFYGKSKKELSIITGINLQTLHKSFERQSVVSAENAVKIAQALGVTVEYLVTGKSPIQKQSKEPEFNLTLCKKYYSLMQKIDSLEPASKKILEQLTNQMK